MEGSQATGWIVRVFGWILSFVGVVAAGVGSRLSGPLFSTGEMFAWILGGTAILALGVYLGWIGKKMCQPTALQRLRADRRPPVLLLRSFRMDELEIHRPFEWSQALVFHPDYFRSRTKYTFEEVLVRALEPVGPVIAIGRPGELAPPLGAARTYVPDERWQSEVWRLSEMSSLVVLVLDDTPALRWEIGAMASREDGLCWLMIAIPPGAHQPEALIAPLRDEFPFLPEAPPSTVAIRFSPDGRPRVYCAASRDLMAETLRQAASYANRSVGPRVAA